MSIHIKSHNNQSVYSYEGFVDRNESYIDSFHNHLLLTLLNGSQMQQQSKRMKFLDCVQTFSNWFQRSVLVRTALAEERRFIQLAKTHLDEEYGHNMSLEKERQNREPIWDPILEGLSSWFAWKMFSLDSLEKIVLVQVLEIGSVLICPAAQRVFAQYNETSYFSLHGEVDELHKIMGIEHLVSLSEEKYKRLYQVQNESWGVFSATMNRMAELVLETK